MAHGLLRGRLRTALLPSDLLQVTPVSAFPTLVEITAASGPAGAVLTDVELARRAACTPRAVRGHLDRLATVEYPFDALLTVAQAPHPPVPGARLMRVAGVPAARNFVGIPYEVRASVHAAARLPDAVTSAGVALKVYAALKSHHRPNGRVFPSIPRLARLAGLHRRSVERGLTLLETAGVVERIGRHSRSNEYILLVDSEP